MSGNESHESIAMDMRSLIESLQSSITSTIEDLDGRATFREDAWERDGGGGGQTRILEDGQVFERAGVNISTVHGTMSEEFSRKLGGNGRNFYASGLSLIFHPQSPMIPTIHANIRYARVGTKAWFGGGTDLTPYYLSEDDVRHFHRALKSVCDHHGAERYPAMKKACDEYFFLKHRGETRGVGGIFFDYLSRDLRKEFEFVRACGEAVMEAYVPIVERRRSEPYTEDQRRWQEIRRGRYAEFNLLYDQGTAFGFQTEGRTESILVSMPPRARWVYAHQPEPGSAEEELMKVLRAPREWV